MNAHVKEREFYMEVKKQEFRDAFKKLKEEFEEETQSVITEVNVDIMSQITNCRIDFSIVDNIDIRVNTDKFIWKPLTTDSKPIKE